MFLGGLAGFAAASLLCAAAPSALVLIAGRAAQGLAGAVLLSSSLALLAQDFTGQSRAGALGIWGATVAAAFAVGPLEGGLLTEALGWRAIFALDAAVALACLPVAVRRLRESRDPDAEGVDWWGTATLSVGLFLAVFALTRGDVAGWGSGPILASVAGAALLLGAFVVVERRGREPMLDLRLCMICGQVGCCDGSKNKHATRHFHATGHPIIRSYEPGEDWWFCYVDELGFEIEGAEPARATG